METKSLSAIADELKMSTSEVIYSSDTSTVLDDVIYTIKDKELEAKRNKMNEGIESFKLCGEYKHVIENGKLIMCGDYCVDYEINKEAAIQYAKHFKLTEEDLKT